MSATPEIIAWKYANLFHPDAEMSEGARNVMPSGADAAVDWLQRQMGGLWVGGSVALTRHSLAFSPNGLNAAAHAEDTSATVRLDDVVNVTDRFGWLTRIVDVRTDTGDTFTFRCFGAKAFADKIRRAVSERQAAVS